MSIRPILAMALTAIAAFSLAAPAAQQTDTFKLEKISVDDYEGTYKAMLTTGQFEQAMPEKPDPQVKAYPEFKSEKPLYGRLSANRSYSNIAGTPYFFAIDESGGTGKGYDRLYFDTDHDFDLTNNKPLTTTEDLPEQFKAYENSGGEVAVFEPLRFEIDCGSELPGCPVELTTFLQVQETMSYVRFIFPEARTGKIRIAGKEVELLLAQCSTISGYWNQPMVYAFTGDDADSMMMVSAMRIIDGKFYSLEGDSIRVRCYEGDMGLLDTSDYGRIERGWLQDSHDRIIDTAKCETADNKLKLPAGDYRPLQIALTDDKIRLGLAAEFDASGATKTPEPIYALTVRKDRPCKLQLGSDPVVVFKSPTPDQTIKPGEQISISAVVRDSRLGCLIAGLEDVTRKVGEPMQLGEGVEYQQYESLDPEVQILDSSGKVVASGKMPFG